MASKQWWTVNAFYDDTEQSYVEHFEAKTWQEAWTQALHAADGVIRKISIFEGRLLAVDLDEAVSVVPIRGKRHSIPVAHVDVSTRHVVVPGRCPACKKDLRRAGALVETYLVAHEWRAHLAHNDKDLASERDGALARSAVKTVDAARLACGACSEVIWDGLHVV